MEIKYEKNGKKLNTLEDLRRCFNVYSVFSYIYKRKRSTVNEIYKNVEINKRTLYEYIKKGIQSDLIQRRKITKKKKNRAHYIIVDSPPLQEFLVEIKTIILEFVDILSNFKVI